MTCGSGRDAILDLARNVAMSEPVRAAAEAHLRDCASCAAEFERQRDLTAALGALAADAAPWNSSAGIEERLHAAFAGRRPVTHPSSRDSSSFDRWTATLTVAAVIVLAVWLGSRPASGPPGDGRRQSADFAQPPTVSPVPEHAARHPVVPGAEVRSAAQRGIARSSKPSRRAAAATQVQSFEFMALPGAVGLPELESGSVVRIALPVGALPEYGLDIMTNGAKTTVEADVLVGQDGMARAIRLVGEDGLSPQDTRSRR